MWSSKEYYQRNKTMLVTKSVIYRQCNPELVKQTTAKYRLKRRIQINRLKMRPCLDCKIQYNPWQMQFDHRDPSLKRYNIGTRTCISEKQLLDEVVKCDIVCANCHAERTHKQILKGKI